MEPEIQPVRVVKLKDDSKAKMGREENQTAPPPQLPLEYRHLQLSDYFGLEPWDRQNEETMGKLNYVYRYASARVQSEDPNAVKAWLLSAEVDLGHPEFGTDRLNYLYRYFRIRETEDKIVEQRRMMEKGVA